MSNQQIITSKIIGEKNNKNILILHGLYGSCDSLLFLAKKLSEKYCIHLLSLRNHSNSFFAEEMNYEIMSQDIENYINEKQIKKTTLIGHSMGGKIAMFFAKNKSEKVEKLIIIDISPISYKNLISYNSIINFHLNILSILKQIDLTEFKNYSEIKTKLTNKNIETRIINLILKNIAIKDKRLIWKINLSAILNNIGNIMDGLNIEDFEEKKIENETLFIKSETSDYIQDKDFKIIKYIFPNSQIIEIKKTSHWVNLDNPNKLCEEISNYLGIKN